MSHDRFSRSQIAQKAPIGLCFRTLRLRESEESREWAHGNVYEPETFTEPVSPAVPTAAGLQSRGRGRSQQLGPFHKHARSLPRSTDQKSAIKRSGGDDGGGRDREMKA